jgi:hypothetical protein
MSRKRKNRARPHPILLEENLIESLPIPGELAVEPHVQRIEGVHQNPRFLSYFFLFLKGRAALLLRSPITSRILSGDHLDFWTRLRFLAIMTFQCSSGKRVGHPASSISHSSLPSESSPATPSKKRMNSMPRSHAHKTR